MKTIAPGCRLASGLSLLLALLSGCTTTPPARPPGARVAWVRYEAEDARANVAAGPATRAYLTPESEAAGRRLVKLEKPGDHIEFTVSRAANGLVLRYSIPDTADGKGQDATLGLSINGEPQEPLRLTSRFTWIYGDFPWTNNPAAGRAHHFFDEVQRQIPAVTKGDVIRLEIGADDKAETYLVDFIELEQVPPPLPRPPDTLSVADFGATANDSTDDAGAFVTCLDTARQQQKPVWVPPGTFILNGDVKGIGGVDLKGAGMWHSKLTGSAPMFYGNGARFSVSDLAIMGEVGHRNDYMPDNAFFGNLGDGSSLTNVWIERLKCGVWSNHGTKNFRIFGCRIRNTMADGVNLCDGTTDSTVEQSHFRNNGDDALATWSPSGDWSSKVICERNRFIHNTIENPWHANGIGIYGGRDHEARGNLVIDTVQSGGGLLISSGHGAIPFAGAFLAEHNRFIRTGGDCYVDGRNGAVWIHAHNSDIEIPLIIRDLDLIAPAHEAITIHGPRIARDVAFTGVKVDGANLSAVRFMPGAEASTVTIDGAPAPAAR